MQPEPNIVKIDSEESAWDFLRKSLDEAFTGTDIQVVFDNWPAINIHIEKNGQNSSLSTKNMEGLIELQRTINRSFSILAYDTPNTTSLTISDKQSLEIFFTISDGSTEIWAALERAIDRISEKVSDKMEPKHVIAVVVSVGLLWAGTSCWSSWLQNQKEIKQLDHETESRQFASESEFKKMKLIADLATRVPQVNAVKEESEIMYNNVLKSVSETDTVSIAGIENISGNTVKKLIKSEPEKTNSVRMDGSYRILKVDSSKDRSFKVNVRNIDTGEVFTAIVNDSLVTLEKHKKALQDAEWNKKPVQLAVNARTKRGSVTSATVIGVEQIEEE